MPRRNSPGFRSNLTTQEVSQISPITQEVSQISRTTQEDSLTSQEEEEDGPTLLEEGNQVQVVLDSVQVETLFSPEAPWLDVYQGGLTSETFATSKFNQKTKKIYRNVKIHLLECEMFSIITMKVPVDWMKS